MAALARQARQLARHAGNSLSDAAARQVEETLDAALADPAAAEAVRSGRLIRPLRHAGLGPVDVEGAWAGRGQTREEPVLAGAGGSGSGPSGPSGGRRAAEARQLLGQRAEQRRAAEAASQAAEQRLDERRREAGTARRRLDEQREEVERLQRELDGARRRLASAEDHLRRAEDAASVASEERERAESRAAQARRAEEEASAALAATGWGPAPSG